MGTNSEKQILGKLDEANVFINKNDAVQYRLLPVSPTAKQPAPLTGYMSSFEDEIDYTDDLYSDREKRVISFIEWCRDRLFLFTYNAEQDGEYAKVRHANPVAKPEDFREGMEFYPVPVFAAGDDADVCDWSEQTHFTLWRDYGSFEEFRELVENGNTVGSLYFYDTEAFSPSFVVWKDKSGKMHAVGGTGRITCGQAGHTIEGKDLTLTDISEYVPFSVYEMCVNPTVMYIPANIYEAIKEKIQREKAQAESAGTTDGASSADGPDGLPEEDAGAQGDGAQTPVTDGLHEKQEDAQEKSPATEGLPDAALHGASTETPDAKNERKHEPAEKVLQQEPAAGTDRAVIESMMYHSRNSGLFYSTKDLVNVHTAIKCSRLVILSGLSGTGKSRLVDIYARALGIDQPTGERYCVIPVRSSWNDDSDLLGYLDLVHQVYRPSETGLVDLLVRAQSHPEDLHLVCFDEMNLARVEHYFSQFLSVLEKPKGKRELHLYDRQYRDRLYNSKDYPDTIEIGENVRFIGTVNVDESTYHFSDKVLDRANVIQLDILNYATEWEDVPCTPPPSSIWTAEKYESLIRRPEHTEATDRLHAFLWDMHMLLQNASPKYGVGPRVVKAVENYLANLPEPAMDGFDAGTALDYQVVQRILTKVRGPENQLGGLLGKDSEKTFGHIFDAYADLSGFSRSRRIIEQKKKEMETYGYCI